MTYWGVNEKIHSRYLFVVHLRRRPFELHLSLHLQCLCHIRPTHCCAIDNLIIVLMSYLGLCFWHYCAREHLCLCTVAPMIRWKSDTVRPNLLLMTNKKLHALSIGTKIDDLNLKNSLKPRFLQPCSVRSGAIFSPV